MALAMRIILIIVVLIVALIIVIITRAFLREKRISSFALSKKNIIDSSFFERLYKKFWKLIHNLSKHLGNYKSIKDMAKKYDKYILTSEGSIKNNIDYITIKVILTIICIIMYVLLVILGALPDNILFLLLAIVIGYVLPDLVWTLNYNYKCNDIFDKLYESIIVMSRSLKQSNLEDAIVNVIEELDGPIKDEYKKMLVDVSYNIPIKDAYLRFYKRTKIKELKNIYYILDINSDNLVEAFDLIRLEFDYINERKYHTTSIDSVLNVLSKIFMLVPIIFVFMIIMIYPDYFNVINNYSTGYIMIVIIVLVYVLLVLTIKKIMGERK